MSETSSPLLRVRLDLAYDGTDFSGWAEQPGLRTVEGTLSAALATVLRLPEPARLTVAGRTDAGVHARGQVVHLDVPAPAWAAVPGRSDRSPAAALVSRLAGVLPTDVVVRSATEAPGAFDARFAALERRYLYRLVGVDGPRDPLRRRDTVWWRRPLDVAAMDEAARGLVGLRDFAAFCKRREGATTTRTLLEFSWQRLDDGVLAATVRADAFCHSMVRSLVGAVVPVGEGRREVAWPQVLQERAVRAPEIHVMPPHGLSLEEVLYPADDELGERARVARSRRDGPNQVASVEASNGVVGGSQGL
ncbi:tRNA pseudouridine synthase A [Humibacillus xanthopallidus]|uniref:tRNA pseudouridine synthase A n=1 Tax=Humibacillus xanthopallidus TaxID=412689 RepID=A0A543HUR9_9MICO|nr:tRNA pseudouridine synthase A [Humibacillus xanthopallidus]TQM62115.1 tRNA pseudouridine38-40 synthase [Humibacillus xanthopallidus]